LDAPANHKLFFFCFKPNPKEYIIYDFHTHHINTHAMLFSMKVIF